MKKKVYKLLKNNYLIDTFKYTSHRLISGFLALSFLVSYTMIAVATENTEVNLLSGISASAEVSAPINLLSGLTAESFSPATSQVGSSYSATSMGTLLTDGKSDTATGEHKWYVSWAPNAGSHVQYSLTAATELNTVVIYAGMLNGSNTQDLIKADEVTISYDNGDGTWRNVTNVSADDKRQDTTPPQVLTFRFGTVTASKIKIFIQNSAAFRMMEIEAYNIAPEYSDANGNPIESYQPGDTVVCKIQLGEMDNLLFIMAVKGQNAKLHVVDIGEYIGDGYWEATVTIPEDIVAPYIECFAWEKDTLKPIRAMMEF